jgi:adenosylhomocysteine nucleosidase
MKIFVCGAMLDELKLVLSSFNNVPCGVTQNGALVEIKNNEDLKDFRFWKGSQHGSAFLIGQPGISKVHGGVSLVGAQPMSAMLGFIIPIYRPDLVLNIGTVGALSGQLEMGEVVIVDSAQYLDREIPIPNYDSYGVGRLDCHIPGDPIFKAMKRVSLYTGNSLTTDKKHLDALLESSSEKVLVKDMEAAACAQICDIFGVKFTSIKSVTDFLDSPERAEDQFLENLNLAVANLSEVTKKAINSLKY